MAQPKKQKVFVTAGSSIDDMNALLDKGWRVVQVHANHGGAQTGTYWLVVIEEIGEGGA